MNHDKLRRGDGSGRGGHLDIMTIKEIKEKKEVGVLKESLQRKSELKRRKEDMHSKQLAHTFLRAPRASKG